MAWFTQLFIFCLLATATMGITGTSTIGTSTSGTTGAPTSPITSTSGTTGAPTSPITSSSGTTGAPSPPTTSTSGTTGAPTSPTTSTSGTTGAPTSPTTSSSGTTGAPTSPTTSTSGTTGAPTSPTTSTSGTTGAPTSPTTSTSGTTGAPTAPTTSTSGTTVAPPAPSTTTPQPGPCASSPCPRDSSCVELIDSFTCVCHPGLFYNEELNTCFLVKTFPSELRIDEVFDSEMLDKSSEVFRKTSNDIISALSETFKNQPGYIGSTVLSLMQGSIIADVDSAFRIESDVTKTVVEDILKNAIEEGNGILSNAEVIVKDTCSRGYCEERTTTCDSLNGLSICTCRTGYVKIDTTEQACVACPSGEKAVDSTTCEPCSFGYSGFNCNEPYLLTVVIVSCVLGTLFLGTLVAVIAVSSRKPKQSTVSSEDSGAFSEFNKPARIPRIPRANPDSGWQPANLETADSGSTHALVTKDRPESLAMENYYDAFNDYTRSQKNQTPSRTGYGNGNGYRARGVNNGSRGTRNPYYDEYDPDDDGFRRY